MFNFTQKMPRMGALHSSDKEILDIIVTKAQTRKRYSFNCQ